jgi:hypothetical protein
MVATFPAGSNTFVPVPNGTVIDFSRDPSKFAINRYAQIVPVKKTVGLYLEMTVEEAGRMIGTDPTEFDWPDGRDAPDNDDGTESFNWRDYRTARKLFGAKLGDLAVDQSEWNIENQHVRIKSQQAMTYRTLKAASILTTAGNYDSTHRSAVSDINGNGGNFAASTTARQDIKRSLMYAAEVIMKDTLSAVEPSALKVVMSPYAARQIALSQEFVDHVKGSPEAYAQFRGELPGRNTMFGGMPDKLYGFDIEVEAASKVTSRKGATRAASWIWPDTSIAMVSRVGELVAKEGPNFTTCCLFIYDKDDMAVEVKHDTDNRVRKVRVIDHFVAKMVAPVSGFLFQNAV